MPYTDPQKRREWERKYRKRPEVKARRAKSQKDYLLRTADKRKVYRKTYNTKTYWERKLKRVYAISTMHEARLKRIEMGL